MRYFLLLLIFPLISFVVPEKGEFTVRIIQDGYEVKPVNGEVWLEKKSFRIDLSLERLDGVYLYADFADSIYRLNDKDTIPGMKDVPPNVLAEVSFNTDRELLINKEGWAYWFYDSTMDWHRFDNVMKITYSKGDMYMGSKTVNRFYFSNDKILPVEEVSDPLYLFFFSAQQSDDHSSLISKLHRYKVKII